jgi:hypothetical protein
MLWSILTSKSVFLKPKLAILSALFNQLFSYATMYRRNEKIASCRIAEIFRTAQNGTTFPETAKVQGSFECL